MYHILHVSQYWYVFSFYIQPKWLRFSPINGIIWYRILLIRIFLNSRVICERILQIDVLQYWFMLNALIVTDTLNFSVLALSIVFLRIYLTTYLPLCYLEKWKLSCKHTLMFDSGAQVQDRLRYRLRPRHQCSPWWWHQYHVQEIYQMTLLLRHN